MKFTKSLEGNFLFSAGSNFELQTEQNDKPIQQISVLK